MASKNLKIAFIGTGIMGAPIAGHIMDAGYELTVYNRTKEKAADLIERGAAWADSVAEAAKDADVAFTMSASPRMWRRSTWRRGPAGLCQGWCLSHRPHHQRARARPPISPAPPRCAASTPSTAP